MKHTAKILCVALSLAMLFAMSVPAMAEGTINKLDTSTLYEDFTDATVTYGSIITEDNSTNSVWQIGTSRYNVAGTNSITDNLYEVGVKVKVTNGKNTNDFMYVQLSYNHNYPLMDARIKCRSTGNVGNIQISDDHVFDESLWKQNDWNDVRFKISENTTAQTFTIDAYVNGNQIVSNQVVNYKDKHKSDSSYADPKQVGIYANGASTANFYVDDVYIASYTSVANFDRNTTVKVVKGQNAVLPATINDVAVTWGAIDEETNTATGLLDGYSVDVKATATIQEIDMPYTATVSDGNLTITKETNYAPVAKIYGATYLGGKLTAVNEIGTITADEAWNGATKTVSMGVHSKAFIWNGNLVPLANIAE